MTGVTPSGPGSRASHEAASASSPKASIPNAAFTPGPWLIHAKHRWIVPAEDAFKEPADALPICQLRDPDERLTEDATLANGFLIAAAPELYEAAMTALGLIEPLTAQGEDAIWRPANKAWEALVAATRKARGDHD